MKCFKNKCKCKIWIRITSIHNEAFTFELLKIESFQERYILVTGDELVEIFPFPLWQSTRKMYFIAVMIYNWLQSLVYTTNTEQSTHFSMYAISKIFTYTMIFVEHTSSKIYCTGFPMSCKMLQQWFSYLCTVGHIYFHVTTWTSNDLHKSYAFLEKYQTFDFNIGDCAFMTLGSELPSHLIQHYVK